MPVVRMRNLRLVDERVVHIYDARESIKNDSDLRGVKFAICESAGGEYLPSWMLEFVNQPATCLLCIVEEADRCSNGS